MKTLPPSSATSALSDLLGSDAGQSRWRRSWPWLLGALLIAAAGAGLWFAFGPSQTAPVRYTSEPLARGDLALSVTANGKIQPTRSVSIGSELSGIVARVRVDVNDRVKAGQSIELKSGGYHLMMMDLKRQLKAGEIVPLTLEFKAMDGSVSKVEVKAVAALTQPAP